MFECLNAPPATTMIPRSAWIDIDIDVFPHLKFKAEAWGVRHFPPWIYCTYSFTAVKRSFPVPTSLLFAIDLWLYYNKGPYTPHMKLQSFSKKIHVKIILCIKNCAEKIVAVVEKATYVWEINAFYAVLCVRYKCFNSNSLVSHPKASRIRKVVKEIRVV